MQKIKIICVGKVKNKSLKILIDDLKKRISRFEILELKEIKDKNIEILKKKEFELIKPYIKSSNYNILLIENGDEFNTKEFYNKLIKIDKEIIFVITGAFGPNENLRNLFNLKLSLSKMTFTHEQAQLLLVEQIYRVHCFENNINYTK